jgi:hypothetical protein
MNPTAEAWFAAWGCLAAAAVLFLLGCLAWARVTGRMPGTEPAPAQRSGECPEPRNHDAGECWCGDEHADRLAGDGEPAWRAS